MSTATATETIVQEISIRGTAERIFEALTDPGQRSQWWGQPGRYQITHMESDLRPGGKWIMRGVGTDRPFSVEGEYLEIDRPRLLVFTWLPSWQGDNTRSTVRFELEESSGITRVCLTHSGLVTEASRTSHRGWPQVLSWLQGFVEQ